MKKLTTVDFSQVILRDFNPPGYVTINCYNRNIDDWVSRVEEIEQYLNEHIGQSGHDWWWAGWTPGIARLPNIPAATAFALKYGIGNV